MKSLPALIAPLLLLTACGGAAAPSVTVTEQQPAPAPTVTVTESGSVRDPIVGSDGEAIRSLLATQGMNYSGPARDLDELANSICEALDNGISPSLLVQVARDSGFSTEEGAAIVAASIVVKCPWNESRV